jgi:hypothetical protein
LIWPGQDRFVAIAKMAESGRIAARRLRGMFGEQSRALAFRKVSTTVITARHAATRVSLRPCANDFAFPPRL